MTQRPGSQVTVDDMAQRVQPARRRLETTRPSVERIAVRTGMGTAATLRLSTSAAPHGGGPPESRRRWFRARGEAGGVRPAGVPAAPGQ
ncbi:hypothetical protein LUW77_00725 [Streptomyces radiopugnans]|nr:hypothetical protein LUW77_00725 [Streptomyces radiopugnans]